MLGTLIVKGTMAIRLQQSSKCVDRTVAHCPRQKSLETSVVVSKAGTTTTRVGVYDQ